jgi:predicted small metal-binding protein
VMAQVAELARKDHGTQTIPPEVAAKVKASIHEE